MLALFFASSPISGEGAPDLEEEIGIVGVAIAPQVLQGIAQNIDDEQVAVGGQQFLDIMARLPMAGHDV